ncbi:MAG: hypothetical protein E6Q97_35780 [Desulfurellales bacterium]|nr:MAG: hypothetical protein E6Q97_35780 [Desulfurellales bacterium]
MKLYKRHTRILAITNADDARWGFRHAHLKTIDGERYLCATNGKMAVCVAVECEACDIDGVIHRMAIQCADLAIQDICRQEDEDGEEELFEGPVNMISRADGAFFDGALFPIPDVKPLDISAVLPKRGDWMLWLLGRLAGPPMSALRRPLVGAAAECARLALPVFERRYPGDARPRAALDLCDRFAHGESIDQKTMRDVYAAADATRRAAAAAAAYAAAAYAADARMATLRQCADIVRKWYPVPPVLESAK